MTKQEFFSRLDQALAPLPPEEKQRILNDYLARFHAGEAAGQTGEAVAASLGGPEELAASILNGRPAPLVPQPPAVPGYTHAGPVDFRPVYAPPAPARGALTVLGLVVGIPLAVGLCALLAAMLTLTAALAAAGVTLLAASGIPAGVNPFLGGAAICAGVALLALAVLLAVGGIGIVRLAIKGVRGFARCCSR